VNTPTTPTPNSTPTSTTPNNGGIGRGGNGTGGIRGRAAEAPQVLPQAGPGFDDV
jgi:hypothetical protein